MSAEPAVTERPLVLLTYDEFVDEWRDCVRSLIGDRPLPPGCTEPTPEEAGAWLALVPDAHGHAADCRCTEFRLAG